MSEMFQHRYIRETPYAILGTPIVASAEQLRTRKAQLEEEIQVSGHPSSERARLEERLDKAYKQVSTGSRRVRTDFFLVDPRLGQMQALAAANQIPTPDLSIDDAFTPHRIKVLHETVWEDLEHLQSDPARIEGMHPRPMRADAEYELPPLLAIEFDC
jgi:hypothetical protein